MSSTIKSLKVTYKPVNDGNTFTQGDTVSGEVRLEAAKDFQAEYLFIKFKGKSSVMWTERHGQTTHVYHSKEKYFSIKHYFVKTHKDDDLETLLTDNGKEYSSVIAPGCHVYPFTFQFPVLDIPSSFIGETGKIIYLLEAQLSRSMRINSKDSTTINFVSKPDLTSVSELMAPQHESKDKNLRFFNSGTVAMDVTLDKTGYFQGGEVKVLSYIQNNSSREIKPKYCVYHKHSFFAQGKRRVHTKKLLKEVGNPIPPSATENVTKIIPIPHDLEPSILNCKNIKVEFRLKVYLDVKYASDPEIKFPLVILQADAFPGVGPPPSAFGTQYPQFGSFTPSQDAGAGAQAQAMDPPPPYMDYGLYPPLTDFGDKYQ